MFGQTIRVETQGKDRYGRTIGTLFVGQRNINLEMVESGMAWQYRKYDKSKLFADAEASARKAKRGLWADAHPVAPWEWRAEKLQLARPAIAFPDLAIILWHINNSPFVFFRERGILAC